MEEISRNNSDKSSSDKSNSKFRLGLIVNPLAGVGGAAGLKGSDGADTVDQALALGATLRAGHRAWEALRCLGDHAAQIDLYVYGGVMGAEAATLAGFAATVCGEPAQERTTAEDTKEAVEKLTRLGLDLLLFVGGDGTARDVCEVLPSAQVVLGVPSGVKMHSGVFAISPRAAAEIVRMMMAHDLVNVDYREVRDIDETMLRRGQVSSKYFGEMLVPQEPRYVQAVKQGGMEVEALVLDDLAADFSENFHKDTLYIIGPGSTTAAIMEHLSLPNTLLGVDVVLGCETIATDVSAKVLESLIDQHSGPANLVLTLIGGQGYLFGRGNQQLSPKVIRRVGRENLWVVATKTKLKNLQGRPLLVDTGDSDLDRELHGFLPVRTGYRDAVLYPLQGDLSPSTKD